MNFPCAKKEVKKSKYQKITRMSYILDHIVIKITHRNRMMVFFGLFVYYLVQLVLFQKKENDAQKNADDIIGADDHVTHFVQAINILLMITTFIALVLGWMKPTFFERLTVFINSILFSLTFGWLILCATNIDLIPACYSINGVIALWLLVMDVFSQLNVKKSAATAQQNIPLNPNQNLQNIHNNHNSLTRTVILQPSTVRTNAIFKSKHKFHTLEDDNKVDMGGETMDNQHHHSSLMEATDENQTYSDAQSIRQAAPTLNNPRQENSIRNHNNINGNMPRNSASPIPIHQNGHSPLGPLSPSYAPAGGASSAAVSPNAAQFEGCRAQMHLLEITDHSIPRDLTWDCFEQVEHRLDSSSCHIYTALWSGIPVIIKLIKADRLTSAVAIAEFETEENVLLRIHHKNVVKLLGSGNVPRKFLVLELLSGGSLSHSLGVRPDSNQQTWARKYTLLETLYIARDLARALQYLHYEFQPQIHIIHRDLKPDNIGFTANGTVKLFDFGLCATVKAQREKTEQYKLTGNTGTLRYMAPEVVLGRSYNQSVDTYSFGILIWQIATGKVPFNSMGKKQFFDRVVIGGQRLKLEKHWPLELKQLMVKCWAEDKNMRPEFTTVVAELEEIISEQEKYEIIRQNKCNNKCLHFCGFLLLKARPALLILFVVLFLYSMTIVIAQKNFVDGASLCIIATFFIYGTSLSYLNVWPYVIVNKSHTGNMITGLEISHIEHNYNIPSSSITHSSIVGGSSNNSNITTANNSNIHISNKHNHSTSPITIITTTAGVGDIEMGGYAFNPINKVAQRNNNNSNAQ